MASVVALVDVGAAHAATRWKPCHEVEGSRATADLIHVRAIRCQPAQTMIFQWLENRYPKRPRAMRDDDGRRYRCRSKLRQGEENPYLHVLCVRRGGAFWFDVGS